MKSKKIIQDPRSVIDFFYQLERFFPDIVKYYFIIYRPTPGIGQRLPMGESRNNSDLLLFAKKKWNFEKKLIIAVNKRGEEALFAEKLLLHSDEEKNRLVEVNKRGFDKWILAKMKTLDSSEVIGVSSKCIIADGRVMHIPMMDFGCPPSDENRQFIKQSLEYMGFGKGLLLNSGKSFHFYGGKLLSNAEWQEFLGYCLLLSPFTDIRYIAHRLLSGYCVLRLTRNKVKPNIPTIIDVLENEKPVMQIN